MRDMEVTIREIRKMEYSLLADFLFEAIYIPEGVEPPPRSIIASPELQLYIQRFGDLDDDKGMVVEFGGKIVGAAWVRIMEDYGHIDNETPSLAISLYQEYRGLGIGTELLKALLHLLQNNGYKRVSLAVQKSNYALKMYQNVGFEIVNESDEEYICMKYLEQKQETSDTTF